MKKLLSGNEAVARGVFEAGVKVASAYPGTPSTEILEEMPKYKDAAWAGETKVLANDYMRVEIHNRKTGWAFAEFYTPEGKLMGVLPYLGSVQDNAGGPRGNMATLRRIESQEVKEEHTKVPILHLILMI